MHNLFKLRDVVDRAPNLSRATSDVPEPFPYLARGTDECPLPEACRTGPTVWWPGPAAGRSGADTWLAARAPPPVPAALGASLLPVVGAGQLAGAASPADTQLAFRSPSWQASYSAPPHRCNFISCPLHCKPLWVFLLSNTFSSFKLRPATNYSLKFLNLGLLPSEGACCRVCLSPPTPRNWDKWLPEGRVVLLNHCFTDWVFSFSILISTSACIQLCFKGNLSAQLIP